MCPVHSTAGRPAGERGEWDIDEGPIPYPASDGTRV